MVSCQFFDTKKPDEAALLKSELNKINWNKIDHFPTPDSCSHHIDTVNQKICLMEFLHSTLNSKVQNDSLLVWPISLDTLSIVVTIEPSAEVHFKTQFIPLVNDTIEREFQIILDEKLKDFPKIQPAIKQGIKVKTIVKTPIIIPIKK